MILKTVVTGRTGSGRCPNYLHTNDHGGIQHGEVSRKGQGGVHEGEGNQELGPLCGERGGGAGSGDGQCLPPEMVRRGRGEGHPRNHEGVACLVIPILALSNVPQELSDGAVFLGVSIVAVLMLIGGALKM